MSRIEYIIKRDGSKESFTSEKIRNAIEKATESLGKDGEGISEKVSSYVLCEIEKTFSNEIPHVEKVQDIIENTLMQIISR